MNVRDILKWAPVVHSIGEAVGQASDDGTVTYKEAIDIASKAAHEAVETIGIADDPVWREHGTETPAKS